MMLGKRVYMSWEAWQQKLHNRQGVRGYVADYGCKKNLVRWMEDEIKGHEGKWEKGGCSG